MNAKQLAQILTALIAWTTARYGCHLDLAHSDTITLILTGVLNHWLHIDTAPPSASNPASRGIPLLCLCGSLGAGLISTGCAHFAKTSTSRHELVKYGAAVPPQWQVVAPIGTLDLPGAGTNGYVTLFGPATGTNTVAGGLFAPRPRIFEAYRETWTDRNAGGGTFVFSDPSASQVLSSATNQTALGGSHQFSVGQITSTITTNAVNAINSTAGGVGTILKAATGKP